MEDEKGRFGEERTDRPETENQPLVCPRCGENFKGSALWDFLSTAARAAVRFS